MPEPDPKTDATTDQAAHDEKKPYARPTLTECGSVAKLTMAKGATLVEISPNRKRGPGPPA